MAVERTECGSGSGSGSSSIVECRRVWKRAVVRASSGQIAYVVETAYTRAAAGELRSYRGRAHIVLGTASSRYTWRAEARTGMRDWGGGRGMPSCPRSTATSGPQAHVALSEKTCIRQPDGGRCSRASARGRVAVPVPVLFGPGGRGARASGAVLLFWSSSGSPSACACACRGLPLSALSRFGALIKQGQAC